MGKIVNLNKFRKARTRVEDVRRAAENRVSHGRDKAEKRRDDDTRARHENDVAARRLDAGEDAEQPD